MRQSGSPFWPKKHKSILNPPPVKEPVPPVRRVRKTLTREEQRQVDSVACSRYQIPLIVLMEHAGLAVADVCEALARAKTTPIHVFAGKGNNGGDAYVAARLLYARGFIVTIWDCFPGITHAGITKTMKDAAHRLGMTVKRADEFEPEKFRSGVSRMVDEQVGGVSCVIIDGIVGTGYEYTRPLPDYLRRVTSKIEIAHVRGARVLSVDIPTGVDANTGQVDPSAVLADCTATFILPKHGSTIGRGREHSGLIRIMPLGLPIDFADRALTE